MTWHTFDLDVNPGDLAINRKHGVRAFMAGGKPRGQIYTAAKYSKAQADAAEQMQFQWSPRGPLSGPLYVEIHTWWPRQHRQGAARGMAMGDVDACGKGLLDALAMGGVIADDAQVERLTQVKDRGQPRAVISVRRADDEQERLL